MDSRPENETNEGSVSKGTEDAAADNSLPEQPKPEAAAPQKSPGKIRRTDAGRPDRTATGKSGPEESAVEAGAEEFEQLTSSRPVKPRSKPKFRIDAAVPAGAVGGGTTSSRPRTRRPAREMRFDEPHGRSVPPPHYQYTLREPDQKENWSVTAGQWLAYIGVLALTIGTAIVVYGHFGGYSNYTPTGWLITTVGQMLLFLGVINLVSGGMEQSNDEVSQRIEMLGEHILRIEQATDHAMRGPKIPAAVYDGEEHVSEHAEQESYLHE